MLTFPSFLHIFIIKVIQKRSNKGLIPHCLFALACNAVKCQPLEPLPTPNPTTWQLTVGNLYAKNKMHMFQL